MEAIDLGLSVKWASCNLGAIAPDDIGDFFAWGELVSKISFLESNYTFERSALICTEGNILRLSSEFDTANHLLGGKWRMPTRNEAIELIECCTHDIFNLNGTFGTKVDSPNGNSIFLPSNGRKVGEEIYDGRRLYYWLSTSVSEVDGIGGDRGWLKLYYSYRTFIGRCIRAVQEY